ncbi:hypothetical protein [Dyella choica]|uniref:Uncharacterized protein n=1 Tax=Dyella choica TaxID=1927959 RepID=A0A3S0S2L2_9GAMM|nr:hypothetical protein [Dyella choica]RUL78953.1 hypothetical protein EKH80_03905 [Dyella choica]
MPKALTRPLQPGKPFVEAGRGKRPIRRFSSWYDNRLVTKEGERILRDLDDWGIAELRKHQLIWSGLDLDTEPPLIERVPDTSFGVREIRGIDRARLRLFLLSLLWRAGATNRMEFDAVSMPESELSQLGDMIRTNNPGPLSFYPATLIQLVPSGEVHNYSPTAGVKKQLSRDGTQECEIPFFRFYFDGLIVHMHRSSRKNCAVDKTLLVGGDDLLLVSIMDTGKSAQYGYMAQVVKEANEGWPDVMNKLNPP